MVALMALLASPTAVSSFTMAQQMDGDAELAGQLVVFGSLFSILTIFLWTFLLKQIGDLTVWREQTGKHRKIQGM